MKNLRFVIVSGLSGAGKSIAIKCFEDLGFFCVDNLPPPLLPKFAELCTQSGSEITRVALGVDIRERDFLENFIDILEDLRNQGYPLKVIYFEARDEVLVRRFSETRRPHPLAKNSPVIEGIRLERDRLKELRGLADLILDTSEYTVHQLKDVLSTQEFSPGPEKSLVIHLLSFGFKYGLPYDLDLLFDVRFLPNPNFLPDLKPLTGRDPDVVSYLSSMERCRVFQEKLTSFLDFLLPLYVEEGKYYLNIGIGCTGGRHRSVYITESLKAYLLGKGYVLSLRHRDVER
jgi:UPF0042 nucleotide-binding protein